MKTDFVLATEHTENSENSIIFSHELTRINTDSSIVSNRGLHGFLSGLEIRELDRKRINKGVDGLSISQYILLCDQFVCLHFHEFPFLGMFNAI